MGRIADWMRGVNSALGADSTLSEAEKAMTSKDMGQDIMSISRYGNRMGDYQIHVNTMPFQSAEDRREWIEDKAMYENAMNVARESAENALADLGSIADMYGIRKLPDVCGCKNLDGLAVEAASEFPRDYVAQKERFAELQYDGGDGPKGPGDGSDGPDF